MAGGAIVALDRALADARYLGDLDRLEALATDWDALPDRRRHASRAAGRPRGPRRSAAAARELAPLAGAGPVAAHVDTLLAFLERHIRRGDDRAPNAERESRVRRAVLDACQALADAYRAHDPGAALDIEAVAASVRRWLEAQTFAPRMGEGGVAIVDAATAPYGCFDDVEVLGLIDADWPERERRSIFYPAFLLQSLGWPEERTPARRGSARPFIELLHVASRRFALSTVTLEDDADRRALGVHPRRPRADAARGRS